MNFYKTKKILFRKIDNTIKFGGKKGVKKSKLIFNLQREFGFGKKTINDYIEDLKDESEIIEEKGFLIYYSELFKEKNDKL